MVLNNGITITWGTTTGCSTNTFPIAYNKYVVVFCSGQDNNDYVIVGLSIDWKTTTQFYVRMAVNKTGFNYPTYWISIGF